ncbi:MAG: ATP-binding protein [Nitrososphaera sp.]
MLKASDERTSDDVSNDDVPIACCRIDAAGFIRECNDMFASLFGYAREDLEHVSLHDVAVGAPIDLIQKFTSGTRHDVGVFSRRLWFKRKDSSTFPAVLNVKLVFDKERSLAYGNIVVIDDTFNYHTIEGIEKDNEELKKKERLKNEFVAIASHELRTPIQPILGFALLAKRGTISQEAAWEGVLSEARRLQQLANDILDVSRIESDNLKYDFAKVKINELIRHAIDSLTTDANKEVNVTFDHASTENDLVIDADRSRITQVISNIVGNAVKFSPHGTIQVVSSVVGDMFEIRISDNGGGIPEDILPRLFEKFVTKGHGEGNKTGTGLGLYISKAIITAHHGEIFALNSTDGATFVIRLPISNGA